MLIDFRHAVSRSLRSPLATVVSAAGLALGLAATMTVYAVVDTLVFRPSAVPEAGRVELLELELAAAGQQQRLAHWSYPAYVALRDALAPDVQAHAVTREPLSLTMTASGGSRRIATELVSPGYFTALGASPALGVDLREPVGGEPQDRRVWLSDSLWQEQFGGSPSVIGSAMTLQGIAFTVAGVLPRGFAGLSEQAQAWVPISAAPAVTFARRLESPTSFWHGVFIAPDAAQTQALDGRLEIASVRVRDAIGMRIGGEAARVSLARRAWLEQRVDPVLRGATGAIAACAALLLAIVAVNLVLLALARQDERRRELGVRVALGASRAALLRTLVGETLIVAVLGLAGAWALTVAGAAWLGRFGDLVRVGGANLADLRVGAGTVAIGLAGAALLAAVVLAGPARATLRLSAPHALGARDEGRRLHGRRWLAGVQFALATTLAIGAAFSALAAWRAVQAPLGFEPARVLTAQAAVPAALTPSDGIGGFLQRWTEALRPQPGVEATAAAACLPVRGGCDSVLMEAVPKISAEEWPVGLNMVGGEYFEVLGIPLLEGRVLDARDAADAPPVAVISATAARRYFGDRPALGQRIRVSMGFPEGEGGALVVGVVGDVLGTELEAEAAPMVYLSVAQASYNDNYILVRARPGVAAGSLAPAIAATLSRVQPELALWDVASMEERFDGLTAKRRLVAGLVATLAGLAVLLAATGVFAVFNLQVQQRRREFGVRIALGASRGAVRRMVLADALGVAGVATAAGIGFGAVAMQGLAARLPGLDGARWPVLSGVALAMAAIALVAGWWPARRASRADPMAVLRQDG